MYDKVDGLYSSTHLSFLPTDDDDEEGEEHACAGHRATEQGLLPNVGPIRRVGGAAASSGAPPRDLRRSRVHYSPRGPRPASADLPPRRRRQGAPRCWRAGSWHAAGGCSQPAGGAAAAQRPRARGRNRNLRPDPARNHSTRARCVQQAARRRRRRLAPGD